MGLLYQEKGAYKEAEPFIRRALAIFRAVLPERHRFIGGNAFTLGELLLDLDRPDEAEPLLREALDIHLEVYGEKGLTTDVKRSLGSCLTTLARHEEAEPLLIDSYTFYKNEPDQEEAQKALEAIIDLYTAWGKPELATAYQDSLALRSSP